MILPNMLIFGAVKSGTGALSAYLQNHPEIFMSALKEPRFFMFSPKEVHRSKKDGRRNIPITTMQDYSALFANAGEFAVRGEASSNYLSSAAAAVRISKTLPGVKLIASLRDPVERACAHYSMLNPDEPLDERLLDSRESHWARSSCYANKLERYLEFFSREQIEVVVFEEWTSNVPEALVQLYEFLEVDASFVPTKQETYVPAVTLAKKHRRTPWFRALKTLVPTRFTNAIKLRRAARDIGQQSLPADIRESMFNWYREDVEQLEEMLGRDLSLWRDGGQSVT